MEHRQVSLFIDISGDRMWKIGAYVLATTQAKGMKQEILKLMIKLIELLWNQVTKRSIK